MVNAQSRPVQWVVFETLMDEPELRAGRWEHLVLAYYPHQMLPGPVLRLAEHQMRVATECGGITTLSVLERAPDMVVDPELRRVGAELTARFREHSRGSALVFNERGLRAAAVRSVLTGFSLAARSRMPTRVFADTKGALRWLAQQDNLPAPIDVEALNEAVRDFCRGEGPSDDLALFQTSDELPPLTR